MKLPIAIISMLALTSAMTLTPRDTDAVVECGDLEVMTVDPADLPEGVSLSDVRKCRNHPLGRNRYVKGASMAPLDAVDAAFYNGTVGAETSPVESLSDNLSSLEKRSCYKGAPYGCSGGYCWKACGNIEKGEWCWTAKKLGLGAWDKCSRWQDCGTATFSCGRGACPSCGCGC
ncbi:hypothetical protein BDV25DRAFT_126703 [Aspergillus avenaceus]|uniref:IDI-2 n=1 Tax=Aspergillus avenaceus TaxID=36643 RepID=A0A5N6U7Z8_ASPAV|nr:hypothetical protein BDV25DRAFT_126703 [Aspergillus avenaceus]